MIVEQIFGRAKAAPDKTALIASGRSLSYRQFSGRIASARQALDRLQISRDRVAALCIRQALDSWVVGLALRSVGVVTVSILTADEIQSLALGPITVIALAEEATAWPGLASAADDVGAPMVTLSRALYAEEADAPRAVDGGGGHILLTSATTGARKKVLIDGPAEKAVAAWNARAAGLDAATSINVLDFGGWTAAGFFWPCAAWRVGGCVVVDQTAERWGSLPLGPPGCRRIAVMTPHMLTELLASACAGARDDGLALLVVAGVLSRALWAAARERLTTDIRSGYGATEAHLAAVTPLDTVEDLVWHRLVEGCELQLVDDLDRPVPQGEVGIIRLRPTRVDAYLDDAEGTRAFFRDGFFYPGDLGVMRRDGRLSLQGRVTDVVNVLGDKLGALPIERTLQERLDAAAVCVFSAPGAAGDEMHVAIQPTRPFSRAELEEALRAAMPQATTGVRVHKVDSFPRNDMGKIVRSELMARLLRAATS